MGVSYTHISGYGIAVERDFITHELLRAIGYHPRYGKLNSIDAFYEMAEKNYEADLYEAWENEVGDEEDVMDFICEKYDLNYDVAGSYYSGDLCYLIGDVRSSNVFWLEEYTPSKDVDVDETRKKLQKFMEETGINHKIGFYSGLAVG